MILQDIFEIASNSKSRRLDELYIPSSIEEAGEILKKYGYRRIGQDSYYGMVFHKKGEKSVLKLFTKQDHAYREFVSIAIRHRDNPHFPRFSRQVVQIKGTEYDAIKTELLSEGNKKEKAIVCHMFFIMHTIFAKGKYDFNSKLKSHVGAKTPEEYEAFYKKWVADNPSLTEAFDIILFNFIDNEKARIDIHEDNLMMRGNTVVIIDPVGATDYVNNRRFIEFWT